MDTLKALFVFQNSLSPAKYLLKCMYRVNELDWVSFWKLTGFQGTHFVCEDEGGMCGGGVCVSIWVCYWGLIGSHLVGVCMGGESGCVC